MPPADAYDPSDRRPIGARGHGWSKAIAGWLAAWGTSANGISVAGMVCGVLAGAALAATGTAPPGGAAERLLWVAGALLVLLRLLANMFDGMVAIATGKASRVGGLYNEAPDRVSDAATLIGLGYAFGGSVSLGYIAACLAIFTAYVRTLGKAAGAQNEFCGPMAKQQRMFVVIVSALYLGVAPAGWRPAWVPAAWGLPAAALAVIAVGCVVTSLRRLGRIAGTLRANSGDRPNGP